MLFMHHQVVIVHSTLSVRLEITFGTMVHNGLGMNSIVMSSQPLGIGITHVTFGTFVPHLVTFMIDCDMMPQTLTIGISLGAIGALISAFLLVMNKVHMILNLCLVSIMLQSTACHRANVKQILVNFSKMSLKCFG